jgi:hypothetical protein
LDEAYPDVRLFADVDQHTTAEFLNEKSAIMRRTNICCVVDVANTFSNDWLRRELSPNSIIVGCVGVGDVEGVEVDDMCGTGDIRLSSFAVVKPCLSGSVAPIRFPNSNWNSPEDWKNCRN